MIAPAKFCSQELQRANASIAKQSLGIDEKIQQENRVVMSIEKYSLSFTTGTLLQHESIEIAKLFLQIQDWKSTRNQAVNENLLQARTHNTLTRICSEIISRLKTFEIQELEQLVIVPSRQQKYLLWLGVCRRYKFIADFALEVLRERYITLKHILSYDDYNAFFNQKSEWHNELNEISPTTQKKLRQVVFKMLREAELLNEQDMILPALLAPELAALLAEHNPQDLSRLPIFEQDIRRTLS